MRALQLVAHALFTLADFVHTQIGSVADQRVLDFLLERYLPRLHKRVREMDFDIAIISLPWMLTLFVDAIPMEVRAPVTARVAPYRNAGCIQNDRLPIEPWCRRAVPSCSRLI